MNIYSIYKATCVKNGKVYIGFASDFENRLKEHKWHHKDKTIKTKFYNAIRKHQWENFTWEVIYQSLDGEHTLKEMEPKFIEWYDSYENGYNSTKGGEGALGNKWSEESKRKRSEMLKGCIPWNKGVKGIPSPKRGIPLREETKEKLRQINLGKKLSQETLSKMILFKPGHEVSEEVRRKLGEASQKDWIIVCPDDTEMKISSLRKFCKQNSLTPSAMVRVAQGKQKDHKGYRCRYP